MKGKFSLPKHIAIVPDGNRRWARKKGLPVWQGHREGIGKNSKEVARHAAESGIEYFTIWGGSYDNFTKRPKEEVEQINNTYRLFIEDLLADKDASRDYKVVFLGEWKDLLEPETVASVEEVQRKTAKNTKFRFTILSAYNGDREILKAVNEIKSSSLGEATADTIKKHLWTAELPPVDLLIRTGGEYRLSTGFMMWDLQYAELHFSPKMWPEFTKKDFIEALEEYSKRERRFGK